MITATIEIIKEEIRAIVHNYSVYENDHFCRMKISLTGGPTGFGVELLEKNYTL